MRLSNCITADVSAFGSCLISHHKSITVALSRDKTENTKDLHVESVKYDYTTPILIYMLFAENVLGRTFISQIICQRVTII